ncbi:Ureohydrolase [Hyaloscypha variabilis F]|uniref:Ureohydrolase n=1 Tax=Hyaloscypha variabilis (strain UAMH 11265 / GT02V1 / F) TaxID=1149755 RepID=A0A2J6QS69_HYAVF|nr:Ureohydrolase [Hyaloscypha variabilis F]
MSLQGVEDLLPTSDPDYRSIKNPLAVSAVTKKLYDQVYEHAKEGRCVLTLRGDHSIAISTIAGTAKAIRERLGIEMAVIWVDAHTDINTPETRESGNVHGMPVAFLSGLAKEDRQDVFGWLKKENLISLKKLVYIGLRDSWKMALGHIGNDTPIHLSFDVDTLDLIEGDFIAECVHESGCLVAMDLVEVNLTLEPGIDDIGGQQTVRSGCSLVRCALGESLL